MSLERTALITRLVEPLATSLGLVLWGVELVGTNRPTARIYVDLPPHGAEADALPGVAPDIEVETATVTEKDTRDDNVSAEQGVSIDQCARLSRMLGLSLDVEDPFADAWTLEVSSPGLERVFFTPEQLPPYRGRLLEVTRHLPHPDFAGRKKFRGTLTEVAGSRFCLALAPADRKQGEPEQVDFAWEEVRKAQLIHFFPAPSKIGKHDKTGKAGRDQADASARLTHPSEATHES